MELTELGKELRKFRIDRGEKLKAMADKFGFSSSYLSGIETGSFKVSQNFLTRLAELYNLDKEQIARFTEAWAMSIKKLNIDLRNATNSQKKAVLCFVNIFKDLTEEDLSKLREFCKERETSI